MISKAMYPNDMPSRDAERPELGAVVRKNPTPVLAPILIFIGGAMLFIVGLILVISINTGAFSEATPIVLLSMAAGLSGFAITGLMIMTMGWAIKAVNSVVISTEYQARLAAHQFYLSRLEDADPDDPEEAEKASQ